MKTKKNILILGVFTALFGLAASTKEFLGCISLPIDGLFYLAGTNSHHVLAFFLDINNFFIIAGFLIVVFSLMFFPPEGPLNASLKFEKWNTWKKRRAYAHLLICSLIMVHIVLFEAGITKFPSICPLSFAELGNVGVFGPAAAFWAAMFLLVFVFGRGLCAWACVYTPVQERSAEILKAAGMDPNRKKFKRRYIIYLLTVLFWFAFIFNIIKHFENLNFSPNNGLGLISMWVFIAGLLTIFPITVFLTHYFGNRFFCKYLCPIGGTMAIYNRFGLLRVKINNSKCVDCSKCEKNCQMGVEISRHVRDSGASIKDSSCIACGDCVDSCPTKALKLGFGS